MIRRYRISMVAAAMTLAACSDSAPTGPSGSSLGSIAGRLESSSSSPSTSSTVVSTSGGASFSVAPSFTIDANGVTVAAARVRADGALEVLRSAALAADGTFRIDSVPADVDGLVLVARSAAGSEIGRVIVHQAVSRGRVAVAAPINGETTVEASVYAEVVKSGMPAEAVNTVELARSIEVAGQSTADALLASTADVRALAAGYRARQETYTDALARQGVALDARQRFDAELPAAVQYAEERMGGASEAGAEARADSAISALLRARGASDAAQLQAQGAAETGLLRAAAVANAAARLDLARAAVAKQVAGRQRLLGAGLRALNVPAAASQSIEQPFAAATAGIATASSVEALQTLPSQAADSAQAAFERYLMASGRVPAQMQTQLSAAIQNLPSQATLEARLSASTGPSATAAAYVGFMVELRAAVQAVVAQTAGANSGGIDGRAAADVFVGLRALVQAR